MPHHRGYSSMHNEIRNLCVAAMFLVASCDPIRTISVSTEIAQPLDWSCVQATLRASQHIQSVGTSPNGVVFATFLVPESLGHPDRSPEVEVYQDETQKGQTRLKFRVLWIGHSGSVEYQRFVERLLTDMQQRAVAACQTG